MKQQMISQYVRDIIGLKKNRLEKNKIKLFFIYNKLCFQNLLYTKIFNVKKTESNIFGYKIRYDNFNSFFAMYSEIFMHGIYSFECNKEKPTIIDCGSNIGISVLYFKHVYPNAIIYAFEPDRKTYSLLRSNIISNRLKDIYLYNVAVGEEETSIKFYSYDDYIGGTGNSINKRHVSFDNAIEYYVEVIRLSDLQLDGVDYLKMDVEGAERGIISDISKTGFITKINNMNFEYHYIPDDKTNRLSSILESLENNGFYYILNTNSMVENKIDKQTYNPKNNMYLLIVDAKRY